MAKKLGTSTGKGFVKGVYDETAGRLKTYTDFFDQDGTTEVKLSDQTNGIYVFYIWDDVNDKYISEILYLASTTRSCSKSIFGGTLHYVPASEEVDPHFYVVSTDLLYRLKIISVTKIVTISNITASVD